MKRQNFGFTAAFDRGVYVQNLERYSLFSNSGTVSGPGAVFLQREASRAYRKCRENGEAQDCPQSAFPSDGGFAWVSESEVAQWIGEAPRADCYRVRYTEGPGDKAWMEEKDRNYLARLEREKAQASSRQTKDSHPAATPAASPQHPIPAGPQELMVVYGKVQALLDVYAACPKADMSYVEQVKTDCGNLSHLEKYTQSELVLAKRRLKTHQQRLMGLLSAVQRRGQSVDPAAGPISPAVLVAAAQAAHSGPMDELKALEEHFLCPITQELMSDPVIAADGQTYDRQAIETWFRMRGARALGPLTGERLVHRELQPNVLIRKLIQEHQEFSPKREQRALTDRDLVLAVQLRQEELDALLAKQREQLEQLSGAAQERDGAIKQLGLARALSPAARRTFSDVQERGAGLGDKAAPARVASEPGITDANIHYAYAKGKTAFLLQDKAGALTFFQLAKDGYKAVKRNATSDPGAIAQATKRLSKLVDGEDGNGGKYSKTKILGM